MTTLFDLDPAAAGAAEPAPNPPQKGQKRANPAPSGIFPPETPETPLNQDVGLNSAIPDAEPLCRLCRLPLSEDEAAAGWCAVHNPGPPRFCRETGVRIGAGGWCRECAETVPGKSARAMLQIGCKAAEVNDGG